MTEVITRKVVANEEDLNRDPITGTPGTHPLGTGGYGKIVARPFRKFGAPAHRTARA
jgi:hypothetical protein